VTFQGRRPPVAVGGRCGARIGATPAESGVAAPGATKASLWSAPISAPLLADAAAAPLLLSLRSGNNAKEMIITAELVKSLSFIVRFTFTSHRPAALSELCV
jgi:hypothetical protein